MLDRDRAAASKSKTDMNNHKHVNLVQPPYHITPRKQNKATTKANNTRFTHAQVPHVVYLRAAHAVGDVDHHRLRHVSQGALRVISAQHRLVHHAKRSPSPDHAKNRTRSAHRLRRGEENKQENILNPVNVFTIIAWTHLQPTDLPLELRIL